MRCPLLTEGFRTNGRSECDSNIVPNIKNGLKPTFDEHGIQAWEGKFARGPATVESKDSEAHLHNSKGGIAEDRDVALVFVQNVEFRLRVHILFTDFGVVVVHSG